MKKFRLSRYTLASLLTLAMSSGRLMAQAAPAAPAAAKEDEEAIVLSPFLVSADEDKGSYQAKSTLAGSRIRTDMRDVGSAVSVVTDQFLKDTGAKNSESLLQYTPSTEISGLSGNFAGLGNNKTVDDTSQRLAPHENTRVRGLSAADNTRDFFLTDIPWDSYNVGRVDLQRGPNAILFGIGKPAGIINASTNAADFKEGGSVEGRYGSYGSIRGSLDYNHVLLRDELALRFSSLDDKTEYRQKPAYNWDRRVFGSLKYDPKFLRVPGARTSVRVNYESGRIESNRPRILPPGDLITPWWTDSGLSAIRTAKLPGLNPLTLGESDGPTILADRMAGDLGAGVRGNNSNYVNKYIGPFGRNYGGIVSVFADPNSGTSKLMTTDITKNASSNLIMPWTIMSGVMSRKDREGTAQNILNYDFYADETLKDPSIFDFYNKLLDGPNKHEWSSFDTFNVSLSQTFFDNRLGFEGVVDVQHYERGQTNLLSEFGQAITIDMNNHLVDGTVNPNYGRAASISDQYANYSYFSNRKSMRVTAFGDLRAEDLLGHTTLSKILGHHVFNALLSKEDFKTENRGWIRYAADASYGADILASPVLTDRAVNTLNYLSPDLTKMTTIAGANISNIKAVQIPTSGPMKVFDMTWAPANASTQKTDAWTDPYGNTHDSQGHLITQSLNPANYRGWNSAPRAIGLISDEAGDRNSLTTSAGLQRSITTSSAANWQGFFFDGAFVPSVGVRVDRQKAYALQPNDVPLQADLSKTVDFNSPLYRLPTTPSNDVKGRSNSWSFVLHTPRFIRQKLWGDTDLTLFYNRSQNFQPAAGRIDVVGNPLPSPEGKTKDYGFAITTLNERLTFKVTRYETKVTNDALQGFGGLYMIYDAEAWGYGFARGNLLRTKLGGWADFTNGYDPQGIVAAQTPAGGWTASQIAYAQQVGDAICNAYMANKPSADWFKLYNIPTADADNGNFISGSQPSGLTVTGDTVSKGTEFELVGQPLKNWNITANASHTTAERLNMAQSLINWVTTRYAVYKTPVMMNGQQVGIIGDVRFWNGSYSPGESLYGKFTREFMSGYYLYRIQENADVPELRPWRFNLVTTYNFEHGALKGAYVGGAYRWEQGVVTGYPVLAGATSSDPRAYDLAHPYKGPSENHVDMWVGYNHKLTAKIDWQIQLNLRNLTAKKELIPVTSQPDGTMAVGRIPDLFGWTLTNTFKF